MKTYTESILRGWHAAVLLPISILSTPGSCPAQATSGLNVSIPASAYTSGCKFQALSYSTQYTETISNAWAANVNLSDLVITKYIDMCSSSLFVMASYGATVANIVVTEQHLVDGYIRDLRKITFSNVTIKSVAANYSSNTETVRLGYEALTVKWYDGTQETKSHP